jgi:hypothetical protein
MSVEGVLAEALAEAARELYDAALASATTPDQTKAFDAASKAADTLIEQGYREDGIEIKRWIADF